MSEKTETKNKVFKAVHEMDPKLDEKDEGFQIAAVLLTALELQSVSQSRIAVTTGFSRSKIAQWFYRLKKSGVIRGRKIHANWADPEDGGISFWLDVAVAQGLLERA